MWLEVGTSNKQPEVVAHFYIQTVKQLKGVPTRIRSDDGTENRIVEAIQIALRSAHLDEHQGLGSFNIGTSPANQRIESLWSQFRNDRIIWWRHFFQEMGDRGVLDISYPITTECLRYCFMQLIKKDLNEFALRWNRHILAPSTNTTLPRGRPDSLYFVPQLYNSKSYKMEADMAEVNEFDDPRFCICLEDNSPEFLEFAEIVLYLKNRDGTIRQKTLNEAFEVYFILLEAVNEYM